MKIFHTNHLNLIKISSLTIDVVITIIALYFSLFLRFDFIVPDLYLYRLEQYWPLVTLLNSVVFSAFGFYNHVWRFASIRQYLVLFYGTLLLPLTTFFISSLNFINQQIFPRSVLIIYWFISFTLIVGLRIFYRILSNRTQLLNRIKKLLGFSAERFSVDESKKSDNFYRRVMIVGAGNAGNQIIREMQQNQNNRIPVVVIDDNKSLHTYKLLGVPVFGDRFSIPTAASAYQIDEIILAIPSASRSEIREIIDIASKTKCELKIIPFLNDLIDGKISFRDVKDVEIEDLLGRDEVVLDTESISDYLRGETVLVTGGGGSIGSELCRQIARYSPARLIVFDIYENNAYQLQQELNSIYGDRFELKTLIGSVRDKQRLDKLFAEYKPGVVFHAAAHKHVPLMEDSPGEAIKNNVFGTLNVAETSARHGSRRFVLISTDKAVNPTNVMGASKRIAELVIQSLSSQYPETNFAAVRFGNVLGSNGSVVPLFKQQIKNDRRVTITHPDITRYFMTIPEAARLVIQTGALAKGGEIYVLDMGEPIKIVDLATELIRLSGLEPHRDVEIAFTGLRPGEKMYEELYHDKESFFQTGHNKILQLHPVRDEIFLTNELKNLKKIIRSDHIELRKLLDWIIQHYPKQTGIV